jgi:hypothetical protein
MEWEPGVLSADYSFVYFDGVNRFYLANEHSDLKTHFTTPPNAFDEFETFPLVRARTDAEQRLEAMHKLECFIQGGDAVIKDIRERDAIIQERDAVIKQRDAIIREKDAIIQDGAAVIKQRDAIIRDIQNSPIWRLTHPKWPAWFHARRR